MPNLYKMVKVCVIFKYLFSDLFGSVSQNEPKTDLNNHRFVPLGVNMAQYEAKSDIPAARSCVD